MNPTVDLVIDSSTGSHSIELVLGSEKSPIRIPLAPEEAAKLSADLCTTLAFSIKPTEAFEEHASVVESEEEPEVEYEDEEVQEEETADSDALRPLHWHRVAKGSSKYRTTLPETDTPVETFLGRKGWNIKIGGKIVNKAPISTKGAAYELVEAMRTEAIKEDVSV